MANKRSLKKTVNLVCEALCVDLIAASLYGNNPQEEELKAVLKSVVHLRLHALGRISHPEPGMPARQYYNDLREQFKACANEVADQIQNL